MMEPDWTQVGVAVTGLLVGVNSYWTRRTNKQVTPSNGKLTSKIIEEIRDDQLLIKADVVVLKRNHVAIAQDLAIHIVEDDEHQRHTDEAFKQLGVSQPPGSTPKPGRRK